MDWYGEHKADQQIYENFFNDLDFKGIMVDVGAADPTEISMSKAFRERGWRTISIDPNPDWIMLHKVHQSEAYQYAISDVTGIMPFYINTRAPMSYSSLGMRYNPDYNVNFSKINVEVITLDSLLKKLEIDHVDFLAVDTEGWELDVMRSFDVKKYSPKVIQLESLEKQDEERYNNYMNEIGYRLWKRVYINNIYIKK